MKLRQHISVLMLTARGTIFKILLIIIAMILTQTAIFTAVLSQADRILPTYTSPYPNSIPLDQIFTDSHIELVLLAAFLGITALLILNGCDFSSKQGYTLARLNITERSVWIWQSVYNTMVYIILLVSELAAIMLMCAIYTRTAEVTGPQTVMLAFYRSDLLHSILPLAEFSRLARNIILIIALGMTTAYFPYSRRRGRISKCGLVLTAAATVNFIAPTGQFASDFILILFSLLSAAAALFGIVFEGDEEDEAEN